MDIITGYQWGDDLSFIGEYKFWRVPGSDEIHMPPHTTLTPPPTGLQLGTEAAWVDGAWIVRGEVLTHLAVK